MLSYKFQPPVHPVTLTKAKQEWNILRSRRQPSASVPSKAAFVASLARRATGSDMEPIFDAIATASSTSSSAG